MTTTKTEWVVQSLHERGWRDGPKSFESIPDAKITMKEDQGKFPKWTFQIIERTTTTTERVIE